MLPVLTFLAMGVVGWFSPSPLYPNAKANICATNISPVGSTVVVYYDKSRRGVTCKVVGSVTGSDHHLVNVSQSLRDQLRFKGATTVRVYRVIGQIQPCAIKPTPKTCGEPPAACVAYVPQPSLIVCI